jgi:hypothetical protein
MSVIVVLPVLAALALVGAGALWVRRTASQPDGPRHPPATAPEISGEFPALRSVRVIRGDAARIGTGRIGTGRIGTGRISTGRISTGRVSAGRVSARRPGTGRIGTAASSVFLGAAPVGQTTPSTTGSQDVE